MNSTPERQSGTLAENRFDEFCRLLECEVIDDANLFAERLQQWEDHYVLIDPTASRRGNHPTIASSQKH